MLSVGWNQVTRFGTGVGNTKTGRLHNLVYIKSHAKMRLKTRRGRHCTAVLTYELEVPSREINDLRAALQRRNINARK